MAKHKVQFSNSHGEYFELEGSESSTGALFFNMAKIFMLARWYDEHGELLAAYSNDREMLLPDWSPGQAVV